MNPKRDSIPLVCLAATSRKHIIISSSIIICATVCKYDSLTLLQAVANVQKCRVGGSGEQIPMEQTKSFLSRLYHG